MKRTPEQWKKILSKKAYKILREKGTEPPFSGKYYDFHEKGVYKCAACGEELFDSNSKYNSGSGWPSFTQPIANNKLTEQDDYTHQMHRQEVSCRNCGSHLGHVFDDGPKPTGKRFCLNSMSLDFKKDKKG